MVLIRRAALGLLLGSALWGGRALSQEPSTGGVQPAGWSHSLSGPGVYDAHCLPGEGVGTWSGESEARWWQWWRRGHGHYPPGYASMIKRQTDYYRRQRHHPNFIHPSWSPHHDATWGYHTTCWRRFPEEYLAPCPGGSCRDLLQPGARPGELVPSEALPDEVAPGAAAPPAELP